MTLRTLAAAAGLTLALGLALPDAARADHRSCGRPAYRYRSSFVVPYAPYTPYAYAPYGYSPGYAPGYYPPSYVYGPGYYSYRRAPVVVYRPVPRRPFLDIRIGF